MSSIEARLDRLRGRMLPRRHDARTIAALTANPGCARRALMDAAGADKQQLAAHAGFPAPFGQSQFAITRGNAFEAQVKENGAAQLLTLLREVLGLDVTEAHYTDLNEVGGNQDSELRHVYTRQRLTAAAAGTGTMFDHPLLRLPVGGRHAYLEPDLIAFQFGGKFHVLEIKSFAVIDGQADGEKVAAAAIQSAVYVHALGELLGDPDAVHHETILVCPRDFSNRPVANRLDVRKQLTVLRRQLSRIARIDDLLDVLPAGLTFDLDQPDLPSAIRQVDARYAPECLSTCELCYFCRDEATDWTARLGKTVLEDLGGIDSIPAALRVARGDPVPAELTEAAGLLAQAARLRGEILGEAV
jgi:hypothetical protein